MLALALSHRLRIGLLVGGWIAIVLVGFTLLTDFQNRPGAAGEPPAQWPAGTVLEQGSEQATLVLFAHPHCSCTRASLGELARILRYAGPKVRTHIVMLQPDGRSEGWVQDVLWRQARALPDVDVTLDPSGVEAARFGALTSGWVVLYDADGRLLFRGGITGSRGHEGDNAGRQAILHLLGEQAPARSETFVFGCPLNDDASYCTQESCPEHS